VNRRTLLNAVLAAIVVGLAVVIVLVPEDEPGPELETLTGLDPGGISRVRLERADGDAISIHRTDDGWSLGSPLEIAANDFRVMALVGVVAAPVHGRFRLGDAELVRFGLSPPRARLLLDDREILFGDTESLHGRRYLKHGGQVYLVDDAYFSHLSARAANYVHPAPLGPRAELNELRIPGLHLFRRSDRWQVEPPTALTSADQVVTLVDFWRNAQATSVRPYDEKLPWLEAVEARLADETLRFGLARTEFELILGRPDLGIQYHLTKSSGEKLLVSP
jgi:hypothetical protein